MAFLIQVLAWWLRQCLNGRWTGEDPSCMCQDDPPGSDLTCSRSKTSEGMVMIVFLYFLDAGLSLKWPFPSIPHTLPMSRHTNFEVLLFQFFIAPQSTCWWGMDILQRLNVYFLVQGYLGGSVCQKKCPDNFLGSGSKVYGETTCRDKKWDNDLRSKYFTQQPTFCFKLTFLCLSRYP